MIDPYIFLQILQKFEINFITGVPDSTFKNLCHFLISQQDNIKNVVAVNEGNAVALAIGNYLGSGKSSLVYLQNSGLGNALNPVLSLADKSIYSIPMLLLVGWRGYPGVLDEPQHQKQGQVTKKLLEAVDIPVVEISDSTEAKKKLISAVEIMQSEKCPVALLTREDLVKKSFSNINDDKNFELNRINTLELISRLISNDYAVFTTTGFIAREFMEIREAMGMREGTDFMCIGGMGHVSTIAAGFAMATGQAKKVICLDGDGSFFMHMGALAILAKNHDLNLLHIVLNNASHESVGGHPSAAKDLDLSQIARACGYKNTAVLSTRFELKTKLLEFLTYSTASFIEIKMSNANAKKPIRPKNLPKDNLSIFIEKHRSI